jgi:Na+/H+ antiporter NhaC
MLLASLAIASSSRAESPALEIDTGLVSLSHLPVKFELTVLARDSSDLYPLEILLDGRLVENRLLSGGKHKLVLESVDLSPGNYQISVLAGDTTVDAALRVIPAWLSILPPLIAIVLALITKEVLISLFSGVFAGALFLFAWNPLTALARTVDRYIVPAVANPDQAAILVFTTLLGGMVALISRSGGTLGIVDRVRRFATTASRGQFSSWALGVLIFFDDYSNILIVGSTMRPITDRLRISREKLAYIVDSTAAPVASLFPISSWIGFEVGLIAAAFATLGVDQSAYMTFVASIPYRFYPIFALVLGFTIAVSGKDFGPMLNAERRARRSGKLLDDDAVPLADLSNEKLVPPTSAPKRAFNALVPIATVVVVTVAGLIVSGSEGLDRAEFSSTGQWLREAFGNANSYAALCWASLAGVVLGFALPLAQGIFDLRQGIEALVEGFRSVFMALVVLILAWSIGSICSDMQTTEFLVGLTAGVLSPHLLPVLVFLLSALVAFATGSSWGTLGILTPLVIPLAHSLSIEFGIAAGTSEYSTILIGTISSVLAGSVWGDHCSPISDTTILSSMASGSDHIAHVRTQLPYALTAGFVGMLVGDIPTAFGLSPWISLVIGSAILVSIVLWFGRRSEPLEQPAA